MIAKTIHVHSARAVWICSATGVTSQSGHAPRSRSISRQSQKTGGRSASDLRDPTENWVIQTADLGAFMLEPAHAEPASNRPAGTPRDPAALDHAPLLFAIFGCEQV